MASILDIISPDPIKPTSWNSSQTDGNYSSRNMMAFQVGVERIIVPVIFSLVIVFGSIGNMLVIFVVIRNKNHQRNTTNMFILNLSVADLTFLVFCVPFHTAVYALPQWPFGQFMCKFVHLVQYSSMITSVFTLVAMSTDRYLAVAHPLLTKHIRTPRKAFITIVIIWILALAMATPWPIYYYVKVYTNFGPQPLSICADNWGSLKRRQIYFLFLFLFAYAIPLVTITIFTTLMVKQLWSIEHPEPNYRGHLKTKRRVTLMVIIMVIAFLVCWFPYHLTWMWLSFFRNSWDRSKKFYSLQVFSHVLSYANSSMNPIIYAFLSVNFRRGFRRACRHGSDQVRSNKYSVTNTDNTALVNLQHNNHHDNHHHLR
ncbi:galanin receptor 2a-like [Tubulanus polymorphus]|uniref:galanin receptor 2a-like n=1 Tax=Tubulanus polymorphus TaxID=672921 RepID=UPI003DA63D1E